MGESNVSGPWQVEGALTVGGDATITGNVVDPPAILFNCSTLTSTAMVGMTSTIYGSTSAYALVMSSTGKAVILTPTSNFTFQSTSF